MKVKKFYLSFSFALLFFPGFAQQAQSFQNLKNKQRVSSLNEDWEEKAIALLKANAYNFTSVNESEFAGSNIKNNLALRLTPQYYSLSDFKKGWTASFTIESIGFTKLSAEKISSISKLADNSVIYHYPDFNIEYKNTEEGLRQNFILNKKRSGNCSVMMNIQSSLKPRLDLDNKLKLLNKKGEIELYYDALKVWDAKGTILLAKMKLKGNELSIIVNDKNAAYPITIDPLNHTPEWETSADGILPALIPALRVDAAYGYTVAGLGDVNGDNYDDVAVSAPAAPDIISSPAIAAVGAVYIYFGSPSGLSVSPSRILKSSTPIANALFGYSVTGGDVTGDGKNDIIIGAPLDQYTATVSGDPSVTVTAGKVYIYRGEDIASLASPTPFLTINLSGSAFNKGLLGLLQSNINVKSLFGFSVAAADDLNGDGKGEVLVGAPGYVGVNLLDVQTGAAYVYYSNNLSTTSPVKLQAPSSLLGIVLPLDNLLFGFSVDGAGDYNKDGKPDVVVGAPGGIINPGGLLSGTAYVYFGNGAGITTTIGAQLVPSASLLSNVANLFGTSVRGVRTSFGTRNGNILIGAPGGTAVTNVLNLQLKTGNVYLYKSKSVSAGSTVTPDQNIPSPRNASLLSLLTNLNLTVTALFGFSIDNTLDINCDGYPDIIVGEPLSTGVGLINADVVGGAAFVFLGTADGSYIPTPYWTLTTVVSPTLGINAASLIGYSVAGARYVKGFSGGPRILVGAPGRSLDFGTGLLNLGATLSTTFSLLAGNNGIGKADVFAFANCGDNTPLPLQLVSFSGKNRDDKVQLSWIAENEISFNHYELQRSTDGTTFSTIAVVLAYGKNGKNVYEYADGSASSGILYYRLKMNDRGGSYKYSPILSFRFDGTSKISVFPNPVRSEFTVSLQGMKPGMYRIEMLNSSGQQQSVKQLFVEGSYTEKMYRKGTPSGIYLIRVTNINGSETKNFSLIMQ